MQECQINANSIREIDLAPFNGLTSLRKLYFSSNGIRYISNINALSTLSSLERLDFSENAMRGIDLDSLANLNQLKYISFEGCIYLRTIYYQSLKPLIDQGLNLRLPTEYLQRQINHVVVPGRQTNYECNVM